VPLRLASALVIACLPSFVLASSVSAEGGGAVAVAEGRRLAEEARFDEALAALARAETSTDLELADLVALLEGRAMVHHARGDDEAFTRDARALASVSPDYAPSRRIPPRLARRLRAATQDSAPLTLDAAHVRSGEAVVVTATVRSDPSALVREVRVSARVGDAPWAEHEGRETRIAAGPTDIVRYHVRAIGPGGVVLVSLGSEDDPRIAPAEALPPRGVVPLPGLAAESGETDGDGRADGSDERRDPGVATGVATEENQRSGPPLWPFLVGGAVLVFAAILIAALVITSSDTAPGLPTHPL
jgi:hypothetical protein